MLFMGHREDDGWLRATFNLTFRASWEMMLQGVYEAWHYFANVEILVDHKPIEIKTPEDILKIPEDRNIVIRGLLMEKLFSTTKSTSSTSMLSATMKN